ncbi:MAG: hypothetical protein EAZ97_02660 [Bacteroidetes bacterium]|nr:MAG: hypothetical protein EAZ97_02660 [Bacteroidota bacterium]
MAVPSKKLFLLDAFALIYRSHFAFSKNPRINSKGLNTGAILGFTNTLLDIIHKEKPTHIGVAFDSKEPTFRHIEYVEYKAQRQKQPEDITLALPYIFQICEAFQIPMLALAGYEADDIVGTIAKKAAKSDFEVFMMSSDKDYAQLVEEHIFLYKPAFLGNAVDILGVKEVLEKWKIKRVDQVIDFLGLQGDAVDNIPGIPGIGEKTAISLLEKFDSMENLIANADQLSGKQRDNIKNFAQQGLLSKRLATIETNVPIDFEEEILEYKGFDEQKLRNLFEELEFRTLKKRVFGDDPTSSNAEKNVKKITSTNSVATPQTDMFGNSGENQQTAIPQSSISPSKKTIQNIIYDYHLVDNQELRKKLIEQLNLQNEFCFDTETTRIGGNFFLFSQSGSLLCSHSCVQIGSPENCARI